MHIAGFRIENYKSFHAPPEAALTPGFNVVVGQNNAGKTALVEGLSFQFSDRPHRTLSVAPSPNSVVNPHSLVTVAWHVTGAELIDLIQAQGHVWVPLQKDGNQQLAMERFAKLVRDGGVLTCRFRAGPALLEAWFPALSPDASKVLSMLVSVARSGGLKLVQSGLSELDSPSRIDGRIANQLPQTVYAFRAERLNVGVSSFGHGTVLRTDAANLPEVLNSLQGGNPARFARLNDIVSTIFPSVKAVTVHPTSENQLEILVWTVEPESERADLAVPLLESGTGIGQVLAMLYVVLTSDTARVILIDEPQSFLHPGAVRKLIEILKEHVQHQFVITTHSPTALTVADPSTLLRLYIDNDAQTAIERLDVTEARDLRLVLADVGARLSDVFGADAILWVEGRTEELCFPAIVQRILRRPLLGTTIVGILHTSEFEGRRSEATIELYNRLSAGRGLLPPAVGFVFDREGRTERDRADLQRRGNVFFLPRRMYENYLLNPVAIAAVASAINGFREGPLSPAEVEVWFEEHRWEARYFESVPAERTTAAWLREIRADHLLSDLFSQLSETRVAYDKVRDGVALTHWLLDNAADDLAEVAGLLAEVLDRRVAVGGGRAVAAEPERAAAQRAEPRRAVARPAALPRPLA